MFVCVAHMDESELTKILRLTMESRPPQTHAHGHVMTYGRVTTYQFAGRVNERGGGLGSRPKKMYGERLGDGVEYHLMRPTPRC